MKYLFALFLFLSACATTGKTDIVLKNVPDCEDHGGLRTIIWDMNLRSFLVVCNDGTAYQGGYR